MAKKSTSSNNQVTVRLDSRVMYGVIALLAVVLAIGLGWFIGQQVGGGDAATGVTADAPAPAAANPLGELQPSNGAASNSLSTSPALAVQPADPAAAGAGALGAGQPVSLEAQPVGEAEPRLWIQEAADQNWVFSMGEIPGDARFEQDFTLSNIGTSELVIEDTSASCGCTAATVGETNIAPGGSTVLRVGYDPRVNQEQGRFIQKQVRIKSNDPLVPLVEFTITADVAAE